MEKKFLYQTRAGLAVSTPAPAAKGRQGRMKRLLLPWLLCALLPMSLGAQTLNVSGTVRDGKSEPLAGVSVVVKGSTVGVSTDASGGYTISAPADGTLVFSFLGMSPREEPVNGRGRVDVTLDEGDAVGLEDVVVVGYGVAAKGGAPFGAKATVSAEKLNVPVTSFDKALQGNVAGLSSLSNSGQPGAGQQVVIRGQTSINSASTPLYIVDGIPVASGNYGNMTQTAATSSADNLTALSSLNPNDIESVTVLKDAAATSIYGSRAANGVILITTKQGRAGKTNFNLRLSNGFSNRASDNPKMMNKDQYIEYLTEAVVNAGASDATIGVNGKQVNKWVASQFLVRNADKDFYDFDWQKATYRENAPISTADFSASGGTDKTKFFTSLSLLDNEGVLIDTYLKRYTGRVNLDHTINRSVKFGVNISLSYNAQRSPLTTSGYYASPVFGAFMYAPIDPGIIDEGSYLYNAKDDDFTPLEAGPNIDYIKTYANANFLANSAYDDFVSRTAKNTTSGYIQWSIIDGLVLKGVGGYDYFYLTEEEWRDARPRGNSASYGHGLAESSITEQLRWNETITLNYLKTFADVHNVNILLGQEASEEGYRYAGGIMQDFPGDYFHYMSQGATPYDVYGARYASSLASFFSAANYNYDGKYYLSASLRGDASSRLSKDNRWSSFWSVGGSWKIKRESFLESVSIINDLTLRASYGTTGSQAGIGRYAALGLYSGVAYNGNSGLFPTQIANPELSWEVAHSLDIGLDVSVLSNRLGATFDFYRRNTKDILLATQLSRTTGFESITSNVGELYNQGIEVEIHGTPVQTKDITWTVGLNLASNKNRITKLYKGEDIINSPYIYREGEDAHSFYTYRWAGVNPDDGSPQYYDKDGNIMKQATGADNRTIVGTATPDVYGGLSTKLTAYGFDLSLMFYYTFGGKIYNASWINFSSAGSRGLYNQIEQVHTSRWRQPGDVADYPKAYYGYATATSGTTTDKSVFDGSYVRLRDITLGYSLPKSWVNAVKLQNVRLYMQGSNLLTFTEYPGGDPEVGGGQYAGYYYLGYPNAKTLTFGVDVKF
jgi:TonB-linked SusC/RagA family outer membrane protein